MRKLLPMLAVAVLSAGLTLIAQAAEKKTITGEGQCAKCALGETKQCQNVIVTEDGETYYLANNAVSKKFHKNICQETKTITATGEVKQEDGKNILEPEKIEVVEE